MVYFPHDKYSQMFWVACVCRHRSRSHTHMAVAGGGFDDLEGWQDRRMERCGQLGPWSADQDGVRTLVIFR